MLKPPKTCAIGYYHQIIRYMTKKHKKSYCIKNAQYCIKCVHLVKIILWEPYGKRQYTYC